MPFFPNQDWPNTKNRPLLFIDIEMTGLDVAVNEIIEVAALVVRSPDFEISKSYYTKIIPEHIETADPKALELLNYSPQSWSEAIPLHQAMEELSKLASFAILAGWIVQNEWNFLLAALDKYKMPFFFDEKTVEVWSLAYVKYHNHPDISRLNLGNVCKLMGISIDRHKPDSDIRATYEIFKRLVQAP